MKKVLLSILLMTGLLSTVSYAQEATMEVKQKAAQDAAEQWLALTDNNEYDESWDNAANFFKSSISQESWDTALKKVRQPLGKLIKRTLLNVQYMTQLPQAPSGEYVVIQYQTSFENASVIETITPMLDNGSWKVSGYYVRPSTAK